MDNNRIERIAKSLTAASWKSAHPEANVPRQVFGDKDFEDESWGNDAMPRFLHTPSGLYLWADYENPEMSDFADWRQSGKMKRFSIADKNDRELLNTDDVGKVLRFLKGKRAGVIAGAISERLAALRLASIPTKSYPPANIAQWMSICMANGREDLAVQIQKGWEAVLVKYPKTRINWPVATKIGSSSIKKNVFGRKDFSVWMGSHMDMSSDELKAVSRLEVPAVIKAPAIAIPKDNETPEDWKSAAAKTTAMLTEISGAFESATEMLEYLRKESGDLERKVADYGPGGKKELTKTGKPSAFSKRVPKWEGQLKAYRQKIDEVEDGVAASKRKVDKAAEAYDNAPVTTVAYEEGMQQALDMALERILDVTDLKKQQEMLLKFRKMSENMAKMEKIDMVASSAKVAGLFDSVASFFDKAMSFLGKGLRSVFSWLSGLKKSVDEVDRWASTVGR